MGTLAFSHPLVTRKCSNFLCNALDEPTQQAATVILTIITLPAQRCKLSGCYKAPPTRGPMPTQTPDGKQPPLQGSSEGIIRWRGGVGGVEGKGLRGCRKHRPLATET